MGFFPLRNIQITGTRRTVAQQFLYSMIVKEKKCTWNIINISNFISRGGNLRETSRLFALSGYLYKCSHKFDISAEWLIIFSLSIYFDQELFEFEMTVLVLLQSNAHES